MEVVAGNERLVGHGAVEQSASRRLGKHRIRIDLPCQFGCFANRAGMFVVSLSTSNCSLPETTTNAVWPAYGLVLRSSGCRNNLSIPLVLFHLVLQEWKHRLQSFGQAMPVFGESGEMPGSIQNLNSALGT